MADEYICESEARKLCDEKELSLAEFEDEEGYAYLGIARIYNLIELENWIKKETQ